MVSFTTFYRFQADTQQLESALRRVDSSTRKLAMSMKMVQDSTSQMGTNALNTFAKLSAGIGALAVPIYKFENATNQMISASGKSAKEMQPLIDLSKKLGATTEHSATQTMIASRNLMQAGFSQQQVIKMLPQTLQLATAGYMDMDKASGMVSDAMKSFNLQASESQRVVNVLAKGSTLAKLSVSDFGEVIGKVGGIASSQGQSFEKTMAQFMAIKDTGLEASVSATGLGSVMARMSKPTKEVRDGFKGLGIDIDKMIKGGANFNNIMQVLSTKQMTTAQSSMIFGIEQQKVGIALSKNYTKVMKYTASLEQSNGAGKKMQDQMNKGLVGATKRFSSALEGLILQSGESGLSGAITRLLDSMTKMITSLSNMGIQWDKVIKYTFMAGAGLLAFGISMKVVSTSMAIFRGVAIAIQGISMAMGVLNVVMSANPIVLFAMASTMAIYGLWKYWSQIIAGIKQGIDWVGEKFAKVQGMLGFGGEDSKIDIHKTLQKQQDNTVLKESKNSISVNNKATIEGSIRVESNNKNINANMKNLQMAYQ